MKVSDRLSGIMLVALGAAAYYGGSLLPPVPGQQVGPNVFPMVIGAALFICGALIFFGIGRNFEEEEKIVVSTDGRSSDEVPEANDLGSRLKIATPPLAVLFYALFSERLGFAITAAIVVAVVAYTMRAKMAYIIGLVLFAPAFVHLVFYKLLRVPLPGGLLKFPWV